MAFTVRIGLIGFLGLLAACVADPDPRRDGTVIATVAGPVVVAAPLPAKRLRIGLGRVVDGRVTPIPAGEFGRWQGALAQVNRVLHHPASLSPVAVGFPPVPEATALFSSLLGVERIEAPAEAGVEALIAQARHQRFDVLLLYELVVRVEDDAALAVLAGLPLIGGVVPASLATGAEGVALAALVDPVTGAVRGHATAWMPRTPLVSLTVSGGEGAAVAELAAFAMVHALAPQAEDMLVLTLGGS